MKILLTGTRSPVTPDLARALAACGHEVHGADCVDGRVARPFLTSFTRVTAPIPRFDAFATDVHRLIGRLTPGLIIPLCEDIFHWRRAAPPDWPLFAPDLDLLMQLHSKFAFIEQARSLGLPVPETKRLADRTAARPADHVFKSEFSRFGVGTLIRPRQAPRPAPSGNPWLQQTWIDGEDLSAHVIARDGRLFALAAYRSAWRAKGGASYHFDPVEPALAREIEDLMATLASSLGVTGQFGCDLRRDGDGRLWLIECNPRATSGLHLLTHDPAALCAAFTGNGAGMLRSHGAACLGPAMWLNGLPRAIATGRTRQWRHDLRHSRDALKGRSMAAAADTMTFALRAMLRGESLQAAMTSDIECNRDLTCM